MAPKILLYTNHNTEVKVILHMLANVLVNDVSLVVWLRDVVVKVKHVANNIRKCVFGNEDIIWEISVCNSKTEK